MSSEQKDMDKLSGRCDRCHRKLKDPESVKRGLGPVCTKKVEAELKEVEKKEVQAGDAVGTNEMQDLAHALGYSEAGGQ